MDKLTLLLILFTLSVATSSAMACDNKRCEKAYLASNLGSLVEQGKVYGCGGAGLGVTARNGHSLSSSYNNAMRHHSYAIYPVVLSLCK